MADHDIQMEDIDATGLRKLPDQRLNEIEFDSQGTVYDDLFIKLQIRPDSCQEFLRKNLRPYRNKSKHQKLIAKGDSESLRKLSDSFITAFGNLVWAKNRRWLLRPDELDEGEQPLQYVPPSKRKEGDHEKFFDVLESLWKRMRTTIYEIKPAYLYPTVNVVDLDDVATQHSSSVEPSSTASDDEIVHRQKPSVFTRTAAMLPPKKTKKTKKQPQPVDRTLPRLGALPPPKNEVTPPGYWPASRTQEAIINIIVDLHTARTNSHPTVFMQAYEENMARLAEWAEEDRRAEASEDNVLIIHGADEKDGGTNDDNTQANDTTTNDTIMTNMVDRPPTKDANTAMTTFQPSPPELKSFTDAYRPTTLPRHPLSAYIPPVLPTSMFLSITPFHVPPNSSNVQPFHWPTAPVLPDSYSTFLDGVCLRANVPDTMDTRRLIVVLAYGWNDFSRVVRNEEAWRNGVMEDLRDASVRLGVRVWRARCCVVAV